MKQHTATVIEDCIQKRPTSHVVHVPLDHCSTPPLLSSLTFTYCKPFLISLKEIACPSVIFFHSQGRWVFLSFCFLLVSFFSILLNALLPYTVERSLLFFLCFHVMSKFVQISLYASAFILCVEQKTFFLDQVWILKVVYSYLCQNN